MRRTAFILIHVQVEITVQSDFFKVFQKMDKKMDFKLA